MPALYQKIEAIAKEEDYDAPFGHDPIKHRMRSALYPALVKELKRQKKVIEEFETTKKAKDSESGEWQGKGNQPWTKHD